MLFLLFNLFFATIFIPGGLLQTIFRIHYAQLVSCIAIGETIFNNFSSVLFISLVQVTKKDSEKNMSINKLFK